MAESHRIGQILEAFGISLRGLLEENNSSGHYPISIKIIIEGFTHPVNLARNLSARHIPSVSYSYGMSRLNDSIKTGVNNRGETFSILLLSVVNKGDDGRDLNFRLADMHTAIQMLISENQSLGGNFTRGVRLRQTYTPRISDKRDLISEFAFLGFHIEVDYIYPIWNMTG